MENFKLAVLLITMSIVSADEEISQELFTTCFPHTKMCDVDATSCFSKDGELMKSTPRLVEECSIFQNDVYRSNKPRNFSISIHPLDLPDYPANVTYSVYSIKKIPAGGDTDWSQPLKLIEGCCDMTLSKSCFLPKYDPENVLVVIIPRTTNRERMPWYCVWDVMEGDGLLESCEENKITMSRLNFTDGRFYIKPGILVPLTGIRREAVSTDYCFFSASKEITSRVLLNGTAVFKRSVHFPTMDMEKDCVTVENEKRSVYELAARYTGICLEGVICFHYRVPKLNSVTWQDDVMCFPAERTRDECDHRKENLYVRAAAAAIPCLMVVLTMFMMGYCFRRYVTKKIEKSRLPSTFIVAKTTYFNDKAPYDESLSQEEAFPIEVYFPMEGLSDDPEDVSIKLDSIEKSQMWSSNDVSMSIGEEGIYCKKFDMHSYVKVKREIDVV